MEIYQIVILIAIAILIISIFLNILFNPLTWIVVALLFIYSYIKKRLLYRRINEYNERMEQEMRKKRESYRSGEAYRRGNDDVIDVDYVEKDDDL